MRTILVAVAGALAGGTTQAQDVLKAAVDAALSAK
jgi:hypothetical protein